jgi:hypothetical protein
MLLFRIVLYKRIAASYSHGKESANCYEYPEIVFATGIKKRSATTIPAIADLRNH